ncbi:MAG: hypothetical protein HY903_08305 [Deltaproteobacteria bacterium]|nr:hypothetical protein [Deltaproteobacteria bacterium]
MSKQLAMMGFGALCTVGLLACSQGSGDNLGNTKTLTFNRLANGDLQYCNDQGECQTLPYTGSCETVEVDVDMRTGTTCQRCILPDGTTEDQGCGTTAVGCVVVTLPDPDCVVCAYIDGAIIFSSCVTTEPECQSDDDCVSSSANGAGRCVDGRCIIESGCTDDTGCPAGFVCEQRMCPMMACAEDGFCPPCVGECVPMPTECRSDSDCPRGMACQLFCTGACPMDAECPPVECSGVCEPTATECTSDQDCPEGFVCQLYDYVNSGGSSAGSDPNGASSDPSFAPPYPGGGSCVAAQNGCLSDRDCPYGTVCEMNCLPTCEPMGNMPCADIALCQGICVEASRYCWSDGDCAPGEICEMGGVIGGTGSGDAAPGSSSSGLVAPQGICVPAEQGCSTDRECGPGFKCELPNCTDPATGSTNCLGGVGVCVPAPIPCQSDFDCGFDGFGPGVCWNGECLYSFDCDLSHALCDMVQPMCDGGKVPTVIGACFGPCVDAGLCEAPAPCVIGGCSGEICADVPIFSACIDRYACFANATCERQADGLCGWTKTDALQACLAGAVP